MADKTITLAFDADTSAVERKMRELGMSGQEAPAGGGDSGPIEGVTEVVINAPGTVSINGAVPATPQAPGQGPVQPGSPGAGTGRQAPKGGDRTADILGAIISSALIQKGLALTFNLGRDPLTSNRSVDKTEGAVMGSLGGVIAGAGLAKALASAGLMVGGPAGLAIGAGVGLLAGGVLGYAGSRKAAADQDRLAIYTRIAQEQETSQARADAAADDAFGRMLRLNPTTTDSLAMIRRRREAIERGPGNRSIRSLGARMQAIEDAGITDSAEYKELAADRSRQMARAASLDAAEREVRLAPLMGLHRLDASEYADNYQRMGLTAGATVSIGATNREIVDLLREVRDSLRATAETGLQSRFAVPASQLLIAN